MEYLGAATYTKRANAAFTLRVYANLSHTIPVRDEVTAKFVRKRFSPPKAAGYRHHENERVLP